MSDEMILGLLCTTILLGFIGGWLVGFMTGVFKFEDRNSTNRFPRPGTEPTRPDGFKPFRRHPDMLAPPEQKTPD